MFAAVLLATAMVGQPESDMLYEREPLVEGVNNPDGSVTIRMIAGHRDGVMLITTTTGLEGKSTSMIGIMAEAHRLPAGEVIADFEGTRLVGLRARPLDKDHPTAKLAAKEGCRYLRVELPYETLRGLAGGKRPIRVRIDGRRIMTLNAEDRAAADMVAEIDKLRRAATEPEKPRVIRGRKTR